MTATDLILASALRGTLIWICGLSAVTILRRSSAAIRHGVWVATLGALLILPVALVMTPKWAVPVAGPAESLMLQPVSGNAAVTPFAPPRHNAGWSVDKTGLAIWVLGFASAIGWFLVGAIRISRLRRGCVTAWHARVPGAAVLESAGIPVPMVCGLWRPTVLLPMTSRDWPRERLRSALLHESAHIRRGDLWVQLLAQAVCSLYWFHPLVWLAARALRKERERACDDAVLRAGVAAPDYAAHLVELARALAGQRLHAPAMADRSDLEPRVRALLDRSRSRRTLGPAAALGIACGLAAILLPAALLRAEVRRTAPAPATIPVMRAPLAPRPARRLLAQANVSGRPAEPQTALPVTGPISGIVMDPTGAVVPGCRVTARSLDPSGVSVTSTDSVWVTATDPSGAYHFDSLPPARYLLQFDVPGFKSSLVMAQNGLQYVWLVLGSTSESVVVGGQKPAVTGVAPPPGPQRLRVGGNVQPARLLSQTQTEYPAELQQLGIEGSVLIHAIISKTGEPTNLKVVNAGVDPRLAQAALDSVRQWRYQPTLLNGEPAAIETTVTVDFKLK